MNAFRLLSQKKRQLSRTKKNEDDEKQALSTSIPLSANFSSLPSTKSRANLLNETILFYEIDFSFLFKVTH